MPDNPIEIAKEAYRQNEAGVTRLPAFTVSESRIIAFPDDVRGKSLPFVLFQAQGKTQSPAIALPIPPGLAVGDGMSYSAYNLGVIGTIMAETFTQMGKQNSVAGVIGAGIGGMVGSIIDKGKQMNAAAAVSVLARRSGFEQVADVLDFTNRQVIAPNTNTTFQNSNIRTYSFTFKMVSRTKTEARAIKKIVEVFREYMYPEGKDVILEYPPTWNIKFHDKDAEVNPYLPQIYSSYLTNLSTAFNSTTNIYHEDGSPVETDIAVSFQETKALTRGDIKKLEQTKASKE